MRKRIVAYCRVSTGSEEQLESMQNQKLFFEDFARKNEYELVDVYADEGISGKQMKNRVQFLKMLSDAQTGVFDMVVVKDISRFARNTVDFLNSIRKLKAMGVEVKFLSNNQTILGDSEFVLTIFSAMAQEESANLSKRVKFGKKVNSKKGRVPRIVYGYDRVDNFTLVPNEKEADTVRLIYDLYVNRDFGASKIARMLTNGDVPTKLNALGGWSPKTIRRILTNPIYIGKHINNKYETLDYLTGRQIRLPKSENILHERPEFRIVADDIFNMAQEKMDSKRKLHKRQGRESSRHVFSTLIKCDACGYSYYRRVRTGKNAGAYWVCSGFNVRGKSFCSNNFKIEEDDLIAYLKRYFSGLIQSKESFMAEITRKCEERYANKSDEKQIERLGARKEKYKSMYVNGIIDIEELKKELAELDDKIREVTGCGRPKPPKRSEINTALIGTDKWSNSDLKRVIDRITVGEEGNVNIYIRKV